MSRIRFRDPLEQHGFVVVPNVVLFDPTLAPAARLLYAVLTHYGRTTGSVSQGLLAEDLGGVSTRTVRTWTTALVAAGHVTVEQVGLRQPNDYVLHASDRNYVSGPKERKSASACRTKDSSRTLERGSGSTSRGAER